MPITTPATGTCAVLVVEDDPDFEFLTRSALGAAGFHVEFTRTLHDTLDLLAISEGVFDAIVLDPNLPDQRGAETLELVRSATQVPIILYSSMTEQRLDQLLAMGADAAVSKMTSNDSLAPTILETVERIPRLLVDAPLEAIDLQAPADFLGIAQTVIDHLAGACAVSTWMVTRVVDQDWVILAAHDPNYGVKAGDVLRWSDSFCSRMVEGRPRIIADTATDHSYSDAPIGRQIDIGCYVGYPLLADGHGLFGTLCGIQPEGHIQPARLQGNELLFESFARILGSALSLDLQRSRMQRRLQVAELAARRDALTGLGNRRAWERALRMEEARCVRFGHLAGVAIIDLDGLKVINDVHGHAAGDDLLKQAADVLLDATREIDQVFRIGGDEFALLLPELGEVGLRVVTDRLHTSLGAAGVSASIGVALRKSAATLADAAEEADAAMYEMKRAGATPTEAPIDR